MITMNNKLPDIGATIQWFGTLYKVTGHTNKTDEVVITWVNGEKIVLWWRDTPGNTIVKE